MQLAPAPVHLTSTNAEPYGMEKYFFSGGLCWRTAHHSRRQKKNHIIDVGKARGTDVGQSPSSAQQPKTVAARGRPSYGRNGDRGAHASPQFTATAA